MIGEFLRENRRGDHSYEIAFFTFFTSVWVESGKLCCFLTLKNLKILSINWEGIGKKM